MINRSELKRLIKKDKKILDEIVDDIMGALNGAEEYVEKLGVKDKNYPRRVSDESYNYRNIQLMERLGFVEQKEFNNGLIAWISYVITPKGRDFYRLLRKEKPQRKKKYGEI